MRSSEPCFAKATQGMLRSSQGSERRLVGAVGFEPTAYSSQSPDTRREAAWSGRYQAALHCQWQRSLELVSRVAYETLDGLATFRFLEPVLKLHGVRSARKGLPEDEVPVLHETG